MNRLHIVHTTTFRYPHPVSVSYNEVRMTPVSEPGQTVVSSSLLIEPQTWAMTYVDYWGTVVTAFEALSQHQVLRITAEHVVDVTDRPDNPVAADLAEYLIQTPSTDPPADVVRLAQDAIAGLDAVSAPEAVATAVRAEMSYIPGATTVHTPASDAWTVRSGVCQDIAHLVVGALRSVGIPARYVSGYLHPVHGGGAGETVVGESHAWVEWWANRWIGYDPTNSIPAGPRHVVVGRGREYDDVAPLRGVYAGGGSAALDVEVRITQEV